jgi:dTDP-L-rhamnose 4-epimerase
MSTKRALVTGGAGFIGSHIVDGLIERGGYEVVVYDNLTPQVHGEARKRPSYLNGAVRLIVADVRDRPALERAVGEADVVLHQAAAVGVGQSMYDIVEYVDVNARGTAMLCEVLARGRHRVKKVLIASSMSNYGEGRYLCATHGPQAPALRPASQLAARDWEVKCPACSAPLEPHQTDEAKPLLPTSVYATTKRDQEELVLNVCRAYGIPAVAFRYFNVYGPRQALSNPYTGVAAIFSSRILNDHAPMIFEDGLQTRDFIHVSDIVQANLLALESDRADGEVLNVGTGRRTSLLQLTELLLDYLGKRGKVVPEVVHKFREGDIRHCYADISRIRATLDFEPRVPVEKGVEDLVGWARNERPVDRVGEAFAELNTFKLVR